jgi:hypothetical protein
MAYVIAARADDQSTWAGQFVVSRKRILANPLRNYQNLIDIFHAGPEHWIWKENWWNHGPSNPTMGESYYYSQVLLETSR